MLEKQTHDTTNQQPIRYLGGKGTTPEENYGGLFCYIVVVTTRTASTADYRSLTEVQLILCSQHLTDVTLRDGRRIQFIMRLLANK